MVNADLWVAYLEWERKGLVPVHLFQGKVFGSGRGVCWVRKVTGGVLLILALSQASKQIYKAGQLRAALNLVTD
ncbi:hypothetical protein E2C01_024419 [Portunus trituberculatus]|uniref:Uncharacterized protein n=1 Tax=Portunus trituberculatus TaxID=210409 RepID=A0A5B7EAA8_PORTR|nr:hypothetical protein [Portunus trituberculatus]